MIVRVWGGWTCLERWDTQFVDGSGGADELAAGIARLIDSLTPPGRHLVAFDGPDAAGKTTLADAVAPHLERPVIRASVDDFHAPAEQRRQRGSLSAEGYYRDAFDLSGLINQLLAPFAARAPTVTSQLWDYAADSARPVTRTVGDSDAVLLVDGVFLLRPELKPWWSLTVYLQVSESTTLQRALDRDADLFGSAEAVRSRYLNRYLPGQALYRSEAAPQDCADLLIDNDEWLAPRVLRWRPPVLDPGV
jgi:uridine kinase